MLKDLQRGLAKFFTNERLIIFLVLIVLAVMMFGYGSSKSMITDGYSSLGHSNGNETAAEATEAPTQEVAPAAAPVAAGVPSKAVANPSDLLPNDENSKFSSLNPTSVNTTHGVMAPDLLRAGPPLSNLETIGQTLRNSNQSIRSDPSIPKVDVGPWMNSTIESDPHRKSFEIGGQ
jgi:hypothetical protein